MLAFALLLTSAILVVVVVAVRVRDCLSLSSSFDFVQDFIHFYSPPLICVSALFVDARRENLPLESTGSAPRCDLLLVT